MRRKLSDLGINPPDESVKVEKLRNVSKLGKISALLI